LALIELSMEYLPKRRTKWQWYEGNPGRWLGCQKLHGVKEKENKKGEDDKSYLHSSSSNIQQHHNSMKYDFRFYEKKPLAITSHLSPLLVHRQGLIPVLRIMIITIVISGKDGSIVSMV
jgi:hypothetical protein